MSGWHMELKHLQVLQYFEDTSEGCRQAEEVVSGLF